MLRQYFSVGFFLNHFYSFWNARKSTKSSPESQLDPPTTPLNIFLPKKWVHFHKIWSEHIFFQVKLSTSAANFGWFRAESIFISFKITLQYLRDKMGSHLVSKCKEFYGKIPFVRNPIFAVLFLQKFFRNMRIPFSSQFNSAEALLYVSSQQWGLYTPKTVSMQTFTVWKTKCHNPI